MPSISHSAPPALFGNHDQLAGLVHTMTWVVAIVGAAVGLICILAGVYAMTTGLSSYGANRIAAGIFMLVIAGSVPLVGKAFGALSGNGGDRSSTKPSPHASATSSPPSPRPTHHAASGQPASPPWAWIGFAVVILLIIVVAIVLLAVLRHRVAAAKAAAADRAKISARWDATLVDLDKGVQQWLSYDKDLALLLAAPAMRDYQCGTTITCVNAMGAAENLRTMRPAKGTSPEDARQRVREFETATAEFSRALAQAIRYATGAGLRKMGRQERRKLEQAQDALRLAQNGATEGERRNAYRLVTRLMNELDMELPAPAQEAIEARVRQLIEAPKLSLAKELSS